MILVLQKNTPEPAIRQLLAQLALQNVKGGCVAGETSILLPLVGETWRLDPAALQALPYGGNRFRFQRHGRNHQRQVRRVLR